MNDISTDDKSLTLDRIARAHELGWGKLGDTLCLFALSELPKSPVDNPIDITRHRTTYAAGFFAGLPQSQLEQLRRGERIRLEQLPPAALQNLQTLVEPEGTSLEAPRQGFFAVSLGFAPNFAVVQPGDVAALFRVFLLPGAQTENTSSQDIDLQTMFEQTQKTLPTLKHQVQLSQNGLWPVTDILTAIQHSDAIKFRLGDGAKDEQIFLSKTQWSAQELLKAVLVVTNTRLSKDGDNYVLDVVADPAEDLQTEQWFSHLSSGENANKSQWLEGKLVKWVNLAQVQQNFVLSAASYSPTKNKFLSQETNRTSCNVRFSSGVKLQIGYYKVATGAEEPSLEHMTETPLFDPWTSVDFSDLGVVQ